MERNPIIPPAAIAAATGIPIRDIRKWLVIYPGAIRISPLGVSNPRLGIRERSIDAFLEWLTKQPKESIIKKREPGKEPTKTRKKPPVYAPSSGPIPYRK